MKHYIENLKMALYYIFEVGEVVYLFIEKDVLNVKFIDLFCIKLNVCTEIKLFCYFDI
jgi:hypothetical protein